ncbi:ABC transporter ATP-binding protein [Aurantimonas sp. VKM B-3413]|uniref:ABC transporter ATP-binding protein n=1 Tax=Aurantimonas sp. VKM B-3413 TaxID=2779401 RepID=UPI001E5C16B0|nr:ABC transporter ATP-binding protein [Aurantimonas sp. VKM B-3413]MCB8837596.1 ABC transporter ATP-binding protein [Aurantimonas sp. VKM B-3413]
MALATKSFGNIRRTFEPWNDAAQKPLVEFDGITKVFGEFTAVDDLSLPIFTREFFALLGPSGCGKSTLLRMLAGFEEPTRGDLRLDGASLIGVPPHRRPVNMMFQSYALFPHMSVEANVAFGLRQDRMARSEIRDRVAEMLKLVKLEPFAKRKPQQLSGGQQQRVALARSLAKRPKVLLLDEPLGALDKKLREETQFELMDLQQDLGLTFLIVTHDQEEAMVMSDRIAVMREGRIVQVATPAVIYEAPETRYVADFIGNVNILEGTVESERNGLTRIAAAGTIVEVEGAASLTAGSPAFFAIRPEKMRISRKAPARSDVNAMKGEVWDIAYLGDVTLFNVKLASGDILRATTINASRSIEEPIGWDEEVWLSFAPDAGVVLVR